MKVFCSEDQAAVLSIAPDAVERVLPLPTILDSHAAVLVHLLLQEQRQRPVLLDASGVREFYPVGVMLLASSLRARQTSGAPARIAGLGFALRRRIGRHPLAHFLDDDGRAGSAVEPL